MVKCNIILIGITGVGKTTIGKSLADKLGKSFIDLDKSIELHCGVDIPTIFAIEGEAGFRERETEELKRAVNQNSNYVLSVGGGCIIRAENRLLITRGGNLVVQLHANISILVERLSRSIAKRPLFDSTEVEKKVKELYASRKEFYDKVTDLKINTSLLKPFQVVEKIIEHMDYLARQ